MNPSDKYKSIIRQLYQINLNHPVKLDLKNSLALYEVLKNPMDDINVIHVGGTNGKGSICYKAAECFKNHGLKTGLFVSPHISSFRERIQVNGKCLTEDDVLVRIA